MQNQADKEQAAFESEWRELGKMIDEDKKMKDIFTKFTADFVAASK